MTDYSNVVPARIILECVPARVHDVATLNLTENGRVIVSVDRRVGNDMAPTAECLRRTLSWEIANGRNGSCAVDVDKLRDDLADGGALSMLLDRVHAGHTVDWDGRAYSGRLDDDAEEASAEIRRLIERKEGYVDETVEVWSTEDWLLFGGDHASVVLRNLAISIDATDDQIAAAAAKCAEIAQGRGAILVGDMAETIREVIAEACEDIAA